MSKRFDRYTSLVFLIIGAAFVIESNGISQSAYGSNVGPDIFPKILGVLLILLSLRLFYETFQYAKNQEKREKLDYQRFLIIFIAAILYAFLLESLGYVITTFLFLIVGFQAMERGSWTKTLLISAAFSFGVYYLFVEVLNGSLPGFPTWFS
ncbi:tripartite tricarboxylate transporter TctB family protein [Bacillus suaedaesalsae]|uniref:Tripartite tricarboxylate transporter TctB family protein n=1 Tax=Bacillus suaedaesalsae TaxID=2810349 RepID=A0ABS2DF37_9BACI|nr:tripartite tricarboxylate transporter TctB family protein [Bacillus suaedaesalsae]MBM6617078.1 tripartite tricarboxylate transporter TctB family protein [Bacillus suaedaesalsae]